MFQLIPPTIVQVELPRMLEQELTLEQKSELEPEQDDDGDLERKTRKSAEWNPPGSL